VTTTVHLPPELIARVDRHARELGISRSRYIRRALEQAVANETAWSRSFSEMLAEAAADTDSHGAVDDLLRSVVTRRTRKKPPRL
jgi:predicted transcriptional regulator